MHKSLPAARCILGNFKNGCGISFVDADFTRLGRRGTNGLEQRQRQSATPRSVNNDVRWKYLDLAFFVFATNSGDPVSIRRGDELRRTAARAQLDIGHSFEGAPHRELNQRS